MSDHSELTEDRRIHWEVTGPEGAYQLTLEPRRYWGGWRLLCDGMEVAAIAEVSDDWPWVEATWRNQGSSITITALWRPEGPTCRLFADGIDVDNGQKLEDCRAAVPAPADPFEEMIAHSSLVDPTYMAGAAAVGAGLWAVAVFHLGFLILIPSTVLAYAICYGMLKLQAALLLRIAQMHHLNPGIRGVLAFALLALPLVAIFAVGILATRS